MFKIESYKGREVESGQLVDVYFNLHRKMWSIRDAATKLVLGHTDDLLVLGNVQFIVNEAGRQRVIREQKKNVHAFARGNFCYLMPVGMMILDQQFTKISYNPYKAGTFVKSLTNESVPSTMFFDRAYLINKSVYTAGGVYGKDS